MVAGIVLALFLIHAASRASSRKSSLPPEDDDEGIRVRFLPDDDDKDDR